jgi:cell wall-associated NlpC family hydrolase
MSAMRDQIVAEARSWLGTPWVHQHRTKGVATDCAGLVIGVARALGLVPPDFDVNGYGRQPDGSLLGVCDRFMRRTSWAEAQPGDVLVVAISGDPQHMGILVPYRHGGLALVHAASNAGEVIETRVMFSAALRLRGVYVLPGVA